jgi:hypothetical protein
MSRNINVNHPTIRCYSVATNSVLRETQKENNSGHFTCRQKFARFCPHLELERRVLRTKPA